METTGAMDSSSRPVGSRALTAAGDERPTSLMASPPMPKAARAGAATDVSAVMMASSGTSTTTSPGWMSRVATHPRPVRGKRPIVTPCSFTPLDFIHLRYASSTLDRACCCCRPGGATPSSKQATLPGTFPLRLFPMPPPPLSSSPPAAAADEDFLFPAIRSGRTRV